MKTGCQWEALPHNFPDFGLVFYYYGIWRKNSDKGESVLDYCFSKLMDIYRYKTRENPLATMLIIGSKSIQNADTAEEKGHDAGKKSRCKVTYSC